MSDFSTFVTHRNHIATAAMASVITVLPGALALAADGDDKIRPFKFSATDAQLNDP